MDEVSSDTIGGRWLTPLLWAVGIGLQFAAPLVRDRVPLSDDLLISSMLAPWWTFLQVCLLAGLLAILKRTSLRWSPAARTTFAIVAAALVALLQPWFLSMLFVRDGIPVEQDPVALAQLWSVPLAFYLVPAGIVVVSWLRRSARFSAMRSLGWGLVFIGVVNLPFQLWLTHLWDTYIRTSGGESVHAPVPPPNRG